VPAMKAQRSGSIINMSSAIAEVGLARRVSHAASKGAVHAMTKSLQVDLAPFNVRVNALLPGTIMTPFVEGYLAESYDDPEGGRQSTRVRQLTRSTADSRQESRGAPARTPKDCRVAAGKVDLERRSLQSQRCCRPRERAAIPSTQPTADPAPNMHFLEGFC
jgi:NAD(P)-dependent dehydrogenase (short-subunit alcohol dehydrogenase family)